MKIKHTQRKIMVRKSAASFGLAALTTVASVGGFTHPMTSSRSRLVAPSASASMSSSSSSSSSSALRMSLSDDLSGVGGNSRADQSQSKSSSSSSSSPGSSSSSSSFGEDGQPPPAMESPPRHSDGEDAVRRYTDATLGAGGDPTVAEGPPRSTTPPSAARLSRWAREAAARSKFAGGDELHEMRARASELRRELADAARSSPSSSSAAAAAVRGWEAEMADMNDRDPDFVYAMSRELMERAIHGGDDASTAEYRRKMEDAGSCMPQLNLHGLWVGK